MASGLIPSSLVEYLRQPVHGEADLAVGDVFFRRPDVQSLYRDTVGSPQINEVLAALTALFPDLHINRAAFLALFCGGLVEAGANPRMAFTAVLDCLRQALEVSHPFCAADDEDEAGDNTRARDASQRLDTLDLEQRVQIDAIRNAVDMLVLPLMAMLMRDVHNHRDFVADTALIERVVDIAGNTTLPFEELHYLSSASSLSFEDELIVVLPVSRTGMVVRAYGINNNFHAFSLLQPLIAEHAKRLKLQGATGWKEWFGKLVGSKDKDESSDSASFLWLQAQAYTAGELVNSMAWAWGEAPVYANGRKQGRCVLLAVDTDERPSRNWTGFCDVIHDAQNPRVELIRFLDTEEVDAYLA